MIVRPLYLHWVTPVYLLRSLLNHAWLQKLKQLSVVRLKLNLNRLIGENEAINRNGSCLFLVLH